MRLCELDALRTRTSCAQVKQHPYTHVRAHKHLRAHTHRRTHTRAWTHCANWPRFAHALAAHKCDERCAHRPLSGYKHMRVAHTCGHRRMHTHTHTRRHTCTRTCAHPIMAHFCVVHDSKSFLSYLLVQVDSHFNGAICRLCITIAFQLECCRGNCWHPHSNH